MYLVLRNLCRVCMPKSTGERNKNSVLLEGEEHRIPTQEEVIDSQIHENTETCSATYHSDEDRTENEMEACIHNEDRKESLDNQLAEDTNEGHISKIYIGLQYNPSNDILTIDILSAQDLPAKDMNSFSDPFTKIEHYIEGKLVEERKTKIKHKNLNPEFNESFTFNISPDEVKQSSFLITVIDDDKITKNDFLGSIWLGDSTKNDDIEVQKNWQEMLCGVRTQYLYTLDTLWKTQHSKEDRTESLDETGGHDSILPENEGSCLTSSNASQHEEGIQTNENIHQNQLSDIVNTCSINPQPAEITNEDKISKIHIGLQYNPSEGKLVIDILSAQNLLARDKNGFSDPYTKIGHYIAGKRIEKRNTKIKHKNLNPEFNESFTFNISPDKVQQSSFLISVIDHDKMKKNDLLGSIWFGDSTQNDDIEVLNNWQEMLGGVRTQSLYTLDI